MAEERAATALYPVHVSNESVTDAAGVGADTPQYRYTATLAGEIERAWQQTWSQQGTFNVPNPVGSLAPTDGSPVPTDKMFVQDMFPYPSGEGLHVGHPLGYIATDVYARYFRMTGRNVLHALGFDAFGLPAEQYAMQTGTHPRIRTEANIVNFRRQLGRLGLGHDARRSFSTTDVEFYKWTQWIFLQIYNAWFDPDLNRARRIDELVAEFESGQRSTGGDTPWSSLSADARADLIDSYRLVYRADSMVNWCPGLGTVLANEEVTVRRPQRPRQLPGVPEAVAAVDDAHHGLLRPAARGPRRAGLAGEGQDHAAQLDRAIHRRIGTVSGRRRGHRGFHHPARHPVRCHLSGAGTRASARRTADRRRLARRRRPAVDVWRRRLRARR